MPAGTQNASKQVLPNPSHNSEDRKCILTCVDQTHPFLAHAQNASQHVMTKAILCQRGHEMHHSMCWSNSSNASEDKKCASTCVEQSPPAPATTQNAYQHLLIKPICILTSVDQTHASENTKCVFTCVEQTNPMPASTQNANQLVLTNPNSCQR